MNLPNTSLTVGQMPDFIFQTLLKKTVHLENEDKQNSAELAPSLDSVEHNQEATSFFPEHEFIEFVPVQQLLHYETDLPYHTLEDVISIMRERGLVRVGR